MVLPEGFEPSKIDPKSIVISISPWEQNDNFFMGIIEPQNMCSEDHCAIHYTTRAKSFIFCDHCALNEKGELACKGEPAEVASAAKQTISILATRAKSFIFCDHCALNEKGELACKGEPAEVASAAKQAISILATRAKCKTYLNYMLFKANFQVKLCNYVAINTNFLECCFLLL